MGLVRSSLSWIEWLDRLERVLNGARQDVRALARTPSGRALSAIDTSRRQIASLRRDLRLLNRSVLPNGAAAADPVSNLQMALDTAVLQLGRAGGLKPMDRDRVLGAIDAALRDALYEAAVLFGPPRLRA